MEGDLIYQFTNPIWRWTAENGVSWFFITVPEDVSSQVRFFSSNQKVAWGSVRVKVKIGESEWQTSLFPHKDTGGYILPIKAVIRKSEKLKEQQLTDVIISLDV